MAKKEDKHEALMMLQVLGHGHPCTIFSERIPVDKFEHVNETSEKAFKALLTEIAEKAYQKLQEKLPKK